MSTPSSSSQRVPMGEKLGAACGDYSLSIVWQTLMFFLPVFYTDTFGLTPAFIAGLFFWVRVIDAVTDPMCGILCDRTRTRWGKYRPFLLWFSLPYGIGLVLMFTTPDLSMTGKQIYAALTYTAMMLIYTVTATPNNCLTAVISGDHVERTSVSSYKFVFAYAAGITVQVLIVPLVEYLGQGDKAAGYQMSMAIFGGLSVIGLLITFFTVRERVVATAPPSSVNRDFRDLIANRPWLILSAMIMICLVYVAVRSAVTSYYFIYYLDRESTMGYFMALGTAFTLLGVLPSKFLAGKFGKVRTVIACSIVIVLTMIGFYFPGPDDLIVLYGLQIVYSFAAGPLFPLFWSMLADTADYSEWKTGRRADGLVFSAGTFSIKVGFAVGGAVVMLALGWFGYVANVEQTASSILGIRLSMSLFPAALAAIGIAIFSRYPLTNAKLDEITADLTERRRSSSKG